MTRECAGLIVEVLEAGCRADVQRILARVDAIHMLSALKAYANGRPVQLGHSGRWFDCNPESEIYFDFDASYRAKP